MADVKQLTMAELEAGLDEIRNSPRDTGALRLIVCRPQINERTPLQEGQLDPVVGLVGDNWRERGSASTDDHAANRDAQLTLMNARRDCADCTGPGALGARRRPDLCRP